MNAAAAGVEVPEPHKPVQITPPYSTVPSSLPADLTKTPCSISHHCTAHLRGLQTHLLEPGTPGQHIPCSAPAKSPGSTQGAPSPLHECSCS